MTTPIELRTQTVWLDAEGIVRVDVKPGADVTLADAHAVVAAIGRQCEQGRRPALIDFTGLRGMERAARSYFAGPETAKYQTVAALVVASPLTRRGELLHGPQPADDPDSHVPGHCVSTRLVADSGCRVTRAERIEEISKVVFGFASLKFAERAGILDDGSALDGLACAVNMLGEELAEAMTRLDQAQDELRRSEEQLRQTQKMEAVGRLAGGVAHDFNNILSVILSTSQLLLEDLPADSVMREDVAQISLAGERGARLTQQLLVFSRQEVIAPAKVDLGLTLNNLDGMLRVMVGESVELSIASESQLPAILAGPSHLEQVIMNLTVNARDAMPDGGKLTIEASAVELDAEFAASHLGAKPGIYVRLAVSDTGSGMDAATKNQIFDPFFTTKEVGKGTGLGLSIVFGIVQQCVGRIDVDSEVGVGTTFRIYFPVADGVAVKTSLLMASLPTGRGETILLVEDEPQVRHVAHSILQRCGYDVLVASGANEALALCEKHGKIALLVTDVVIPRTSGPELARQLAKTQPDLKTLFMSGYTNDTMFHHGILSSGAAYLQKPLTPHALATKVRELLDVVEPAHA